MELAFIGLFLLKLGRLNVKHDVAQLTTLLLLLYGTVRYRKHVIERYNTVAKGQGGLTSASAADFASSASILCEHDRLSTMWESQDQPVDDDVIWVAKDSIGISNALVSFVQSRYFDSPNEAAIITNAHASLDAEGKVTLDMIKERAREERNK